MAVKVWVDMGKGEMSGNYSSSQLQQRLGLVTIKLPCPAANTFLALICISWHFLALFWNFLAFFKLFDICHVSRDTQRIKINGQNCLGPWLLWFGCEGDLKIFEQKNDWPTEWMKQLWGCLRNSPSYTRLLMTNTRGGGTMGHIIALPYPKTWIDLLTGKPMLNKFVWWIGIRNFTYLSLSTWYLKINGCCQSIKVDQNITCIGFKP